MPDPTREEMSMNTRYTSIRALVSPFAVLALSVAAVPALAETMHARLSGYQEVPSVSSPGSGEFRAKIDKRGQTIDYELSYDGTQGKVFMAHIHAAQAGVNGGIVVWLCGNPADGGTPPVAGVPACPVPGGTVSGTITTALITPNGNPVTNGTPATGALGQLFTAGDFDELVNAMQARVTYVNVHTTAASGGVPGGELRGQIR
jgi:hypothetical protein